MTIDGETKTNVGPRILSIGKLLHKVIIRAIVGDDNDPESKLGNITDLKNGFDFVIRKELTTGDGYPKYDGSAFSRNTSPTGDPAEIKLWVEALHDLTKLRNPKDLEVLEKELAIHRGLIADDSEAFDEAAFDAKWKAKAAGEVDELMNHTTGGVAVTVDVTSEAPTGLSERENPATETAAPAAEAPAEDIPIEDDAFLAQLDEFEDN